MGARVGLLAAAALMINYLLNVAAGISTGVGALVSAVPSLQPRTLVNHRRVRETGVVLMTRRTCLSRACWT